MLVIDIAIPGDVRVDENEQEKIIEHLNFAVELRRLWKVKTNVIPIVVGALETVPKGLE